MKKPENISKFLCGGRNKEAIVAFYAPKPVPVKNKDAISMAFDYLLRTPKSDTAQ